MNAVPSIPDLTGRGAGAPAPLRARRCVRHATREAVGRCSACGGFFCRECISEHGGRLVCASCLAKAAVKAAEKAGGAMAALWRGAVVCAGLLLLWVLFQTLGGLLLDIPADVHDGTIWRRPFGD